MTGTSVADEVHPLSALDTLFLHLEDGHCALHIGGVGVFDGPAPAPAEMRSRYRELIADFPRYNQVLRRTPLDLRRPRWVDAGRVDLDYHLRRTALPEPGNLSRLEELVGRVMSAPLDPDRPLWEAWVVEGLEDGRWALVTKVHHSLVDGLGGMAVFERLLDRPPGPPRSLLLRRGEPKPGVLGHGVLGQLVAVTRAPVRTAATLARTGEGLVRYARSLRPTPANSLNGALGRSRRYRTLTVEMADVRTVRSAFGGTVNDVVLAMVTRGFRDLLLARGERPAVRGVRCLVPVSVRTAEEAAAGANSITALLVDLPVEADAAASAYDLLRTRMDRLKGSGEAAAGGHGLAVADLLPQPVVAAALSAVRRIPQRVLTTVATNVPGPRRPQSLLGRRMIALYPYVPIAERIRIGIAVTSYADRLHFGVTCDRDGVPDVDLLVTALADGLTDLVKDAETR